MDIILGINAGPGPRGGFTADRPWTADNARELMEYVAQNLHGDRVKAVSFGNEPELAWRILHIPLSAPRVEQGIRLFNSVLQEVYKAQNKPTPMLIASDSTNFGYLGDVLAGTGSIVSAAAWHSYALGSNNCPPGAAMIQVTAQNARDANFLDVTARLARMVRTALQSRGISAQLWQTETALTVCGGQKGIDDTFIVVPHLLSSLGALAIEQNKVYVRQSLIGSYYGLLDINTFEPRPTYFASLLFKKLVGPAVLEAVATNEQGAALVSPSIASQDARVFVHCTSPRYTSGYKVGSITYLVINLADRQRTVRLDSATGEAHVFTLAAAQGNPTASQATLNGILLSYNSISNMQQFEPLVVQLSSSPNNTESGGASFIKLPAFSATFIVLPSANISSCNEQPIALPATSKGSSSLPDSASESGSKQGAVYNSMVLTLAVLSAIAATILL